MKTGLSVTSTPVSLPDAAALAAQAELASIQGVHNVWFCGSWCGYGFHEDGVRSGLAVVDFIRKRDVREQLLV